jgi:hypothetical protein
MVCCCGGAEAAGAEADRHEATWKWKFKLPWREAGPPSHLGDNVDLDQ